MSIPSFSRIKSNFSEAFLTPGMQGGGACRSWSWSCLCTSASAEMDIFSFGLPSCQFPAEPPLLSPQAPFISISFLQLLLHPFLANRSIRLFPWLSRALGPQVQVSVNLWPKSLDTPHSLLLFLSHMVSQRACCSPGLRIRAPLSSHIHQTCLGVLVPSQEVSGALHGSQWSGNN